MSVIPQILDIHLEEAAILWLRRTDAVRQPQFTLKALAKLDDRLDAHIDGLRVAGDSGWELCRNALEVAGPGEVFAASSLAFASMARDRIEASLTIGTSSLEHSRAAASALGWRLPDEAQPHIGSLLNSSDPLRQRIGLSGAAIHRIVPGRIKHYIQHDNALVRARACRAIGEFGSTDRRDALADQLRDANEECRFWASWSAARFSNRDAVDTLASFATAQSSRSQAAAAMVMRVGDHASASTLQHQLGKTRNGVVAAGAFGDPALMPYLFEQMADPVLARPAVEAFSMITGLDVLFENLGTPRSEEFESGPTEEAENENVATDPDENLPWPKLDAIVQWWEHHRSEFQNGLRYLAGRLITDDWLQHVLRAGFQRQRAAAALELAILHPQEPLFEIRAPGFRQQRQLAGRGARM